MSIVKKCYITDTNMYDMCMYFGIMSHFDTLNVHSYCDLSDLRIYYMAKMIIELRSDIEENDSKIAEIMTIILRYITVYYKVLNIQ